MQAIRITGDVDQNHRLIATVPDSVAPGKVEILMIAPASIEDDAGATWFESTAREWHDDLADSRQDIYSISDGMPVNDPGEI